MFVINSPGKIPVSWTVQRRKIKVFVHVRKTKREQFLSCLVRKQQQNV